MLFYKSDFMIKSLMLNCQFNSYVTRVNQKIINFFYNYYLMAKYCNKLPSKGELYDTVHQYNLFQT
jgi:hypothetical protein